MDGPLDHEDNTESHAFSIISLFIFPCWAKPLETSLFQPDSIRVMGDKSTARDTMKKAGVPTVPGSEGLLQVSYSSIGIIFWSLW